MVNFLTTTDADHLQLNRMFMYYKAFMFADENYTFLFFFFICMIHNFKHYTNLLLYL